MLPAILIAAAGALFVGAIIFCIWLESGLPTGLNDTVVELRETKGPYASRWTQKVLYDAWGVPYVKKGSYNEASLFEDGKTSDYWLRGTEWQRISGPPVTFGRRPQHAFGVKRSPNEIGGASE